MDAYEILSFIQGHVVEISSPDRKKPIGIADKKGVNNLASYTNEYSRLPEQIMERHYFKDIDNTIADLINQIKTLQAQGQYDRVNAIIKENKENLAQYVIGSDYINAIDEEIRNLEIYAKSKKQSIYYEESEPEYAVHSDVWIGNEKI